MDRLMSKKRQKCNPTQALVGDMDATEVVGNRVFKIRYVLGYGKRKQKTFAEEMGETDDNWSVWELGYGTNKLPVLFPPRVAVLLCKRAEENVTLDYIYRGLFRGVDPKWADLLKAAPDRVDVMRPPRRKSGKRRRG